MSIRKILIISLGFLTVLVIAVLIGASFVDVNQYKGFIAEKISAATGRDMSISGDLELAISLAPAVVANGVTFANAPWGSKPEMVTVKRVEAKAALLPLVFGKIEVKRFVLIESDILLETNAEGRGNWEFGKAKAKEEEPKKASDSELPALDITEIRIENARITYRDGKTKQTTQVGIKRLTANARSQGSPIELKLAASYNDIPIDASGTLGPLGALVKNESFPIMMTVNVAGVKADLDGTIDKPKDAKGIKLVTQLTIADLKSLSKLTGKELPSVGPIGVRATLSDEEGVYSVNDLKGTLKAGDADVAFEGSITNALQAKGVNLAVSVKATNLKGLAKLAGTELPDVGPLQVTAKVSDPKSGVYNVNDLKAKLAKSDLAGDVSAAEAGKRPNVTAHLTASLIDLTPFMGEDKGKAPKKEAKESDRVFPSDPLPLDGLRAVDLEVTLKADRIRTPNLVLDKANVAVKLQNGQLTVKPLTASVGGGTFAADLSLDAKGKTALVSANIDAKQVDLGTLLKETKQADLMQGGKTNVTVRLKGNGDSVSAIMAGLNGNLLVNVGEARINNKEVDKVATGVYAATRGMINPFATTDQYTDLQCAVIRFDIKDGIAKTDKGIAAESAKLIVVGSGEVDLKTEQLHLGMHPDARKGIGVGSLAKLVVIGGTLAHPKPEADPKELVTKGAEIGAAVATGGLSVLALGLFKSGSADEYPCATALGKAPAKAASSAGTQPSGAQQQKAASSTEAQPTLSKEETKEEGAGGLLNGIKKGIFGK
ncbi:MAG: AsmA family protein [Gammaproteobacteria bacterium]|nr:AsmA family protein [Gammaproteobacteria bacterium]